MIDREEIIRGLQIERECVSRDCDRDCARCDLVQDREWLLAVYDGALEMLKEQEAVKPIKMQRMDDNFSFFVPYFLCGNCRYELAGEDVMFCAHCGKAVKWE